MRARLAYSSTKDSESCEMDLLYGSSYVDSVTCYSPIDTFEQLFSRSGYIMTGKCCVSQLKVND
jgi:hypothetical protein